MIPITNHLCEKDEEEAPATWDPGESICTLRLIDEVSDEEEPEHLRSWGCVNNKLYIEGNTTRRVVDHGQHFSDDVFRDVAAPNDDAMPESINNQHSVPGIKQLQHTVLSFYVADEDKEAYFGEVKVPSSEDQTPCQPYVKLCMNEQLNLFLRASYSEGQNNRLDHPIPLTPTIISSPMITEGADKVPLEMLLGSSTGEELFHMKIKIVRSMDLLISSRIKLLLRSLWLFTSLMNLLQILLRCTRD